MSRKNTLAVALLGLIISSYGYSNLRKNKAYAEAQVNLIMSSLKQCKLKFAPGKSSNVDLWIGTPDASRNLARYDEGIGVDGVVQTFSNPNGSLTFTIGYNDFDLDVINPLLGKVAWINYVTGVTGRYPIYRCRGVVVDQNTFGRCVHKYYTSVIISQLCRFGVQ